MTFVVFVAVELSPNDPATAALGTFSSATERERFAASHGLDDPLLVRYFRFLGDLLHGNLGESITTHEPVSTMIGRALPVTLQLTGLAMAIAILAAFVLGMTSASSRDRWPDRTIRVFSSAGLAAPDFWIGLMAVQFLSVRLGLLPSGGYVPFSDSVSMWFRLLILPAVVLAIPVAAALTAVVRASVMQEMDRDYVRTARGNGLTVSTVLVKHVLRNAMLAPLTVVGVRAGYLLGGAIIIESIYQLPGMGTVLINGVQQGDLAPIRGCAIVAAIVFLIVNLVVDLLYLVINPRMRSET